MFFVLRPSGANSLANATEHAETALPQDITGLAPGSYDVGRVAWAASPVEVLANVAAPIFKATAAGGWADEIGANDLAAEGTALTATTTPSGSAASDIPIGGRLTGPATGLPSGAAARTLVSVVAYDPGNAVLSAGVSYGDPSANQAFGAVRRGRQLSTLGWGEGNDSFSPYAIVPGQWVVQTLCLAGDGSWTHFINGIEIDSGSHTFATTLTRFVIGGTLSASVSSINTTPMKAASVQVYDFALSAGEVLSLSQALANQYLTGQTTAPLAANPGTWNLDTGSTEYRPASDFENGVGAYRIELVSQTLSPPASYTSLVLTGDAQAPDAEVVVRGTDLAGNTADATINVDNIAPSPRAIDDVVAVAEGGSVSASVLDNDVAGDVDETLTITSVGAATIGAARLTSATINGATIDVVTTGTGAGQIVLPYTITNTSGLTDSATLTVNISAGASAVPDRFTSTMWGVAPIRDAQGNRIDFTISELPPSDETITGIFATPDGGTTLWPLGGAVPNTYTLRTATPDTTYTLHLIARSSAGDSVLSDTARVVTPTYNLSITETGYTIPAGGTFSVTIADTGTIDGTYSGLATNDLLTGPLSIVPPAITDNGDQTATRTYDGLWFHEDSLVPFNVTQDWYIDAVSQGTNGGPEFAFTGASNGASITARSTGSDAGANDRVAISNAVTAASDVIAPTYSAFSPADNATGVGLTTTFVATLSETVVAATGNYYLRTGGSVIETFNIATGTGDNGGTVTVSDDKVTITPGTALTASTAYAIRADAGVVEDLAGNGVAAIATDAVWNVTSAATAGPVYGKAVSLAFSSPSGTTGTGLVSAAETMGPIGGGRTNWVESAENSDTTITDPQDSTGATATGLTILVENAGSKDPSRAEDDGTPFFHVMRQGHKVFGADIYIITLPEPYATKCDIAVFVEWGYYHSGQTYSLTIGGETKSFTCSDLPLYRAGTGSVEETGSQNGSYAHWRGLTGANHTITLTTPGSGSALNAVALQIIERQD